MHIVRAHITKHIYIYTYSFICETEQSIKPHKSGGCSKRHGAASAAAHTTLLLQPHLRNTEKRNECLPWNWNSSLAYIIILVWVQILNSSKPHTHTEMHYTRAAVQSCRLMLPLYFYFLIRRARKSCSALCIYDVYKYMIQRSVCVQNHRMYVYKL